MKKINRSHNVRIDEESGHYFPDRTRMDAPEDLLGDIEIWICNETEIETDRDNVEPHFHICKRGVELEVQIRQIEQLNIWEAETRNMSWIGLEDLYNSISKWLNKIAYDTDITNKEAIRQEWNRHNLSNRVARHEL